MSKQDLGFSVYQLIVGEDAFDISTFSIINDEDTEIEEVTRRKSKEKEIVSIKKIGKGTIDNRFITICFSSGDKYPYSDKIINSDLEEQENPRTPEELELDKQLFVLIDSKTQRIFISNLKKKLYLKDWLKDKINKDIVIKAIIQEEQFIDKIESIDKISFSITPSLFNSGNRGLLSEELVKDIFGFDAEKACIELSYKNRRKSKKIIDKLNFLKKHKNEFDEITIIGRGDDNFESIFNMNEVITKVVIKVRIDNKSKLFDEQEVFQSLIDKIKEDE